MDEVEVDVNVRREDEEVVEDDYDVRRRKHNGNEENQRSTQSKDENIAQTPDRWTRLTVVEPVSSAGVLAPALPLDVLDVRRMVVVNRGP